MKIVSLLTAFAALLCWAPAPLHAFTVVAPASFGSSSSTALFAKAPSEKVEKAIQEAKAASEKYGAASPEARVAWDVVEELDAADNSEASKAPLDEECELDLETMEAASEECVEFADKLEQVEAFVAANPVQGPGLSKMQDLATKLKAIPIAKKAPKAHKPDPAYTAALNQALEVQKEFGKGSPEAILAWEALEEIASAGLENSLGGSLSAEECDLTDEEFQEACEAMEEVKTVLGSTQK